MNAGTSQGKDGAVSIEGPNQCPHLCLPITRQTFFKEQSSYVAVSFCSNLMLVGCITVSGDKQPSNFT